MIKEQRITYKSCRTDRDIDISAYFYLPEGEIKGIVQLSHGMCEYVERYEDLAEFLTKNGYVFCGNDHLGHGRTGEDSGEFGYFGEKDGWKCLSKDVHNLTFIAQERFPGVPLILLGHSMGSFVARDYAAKYGYDIDALILSGTSGGETFIDVGIKLADRIAKRKGEKYVSSILNRAAFSGYNRGKSGGKTGFEWLSRDREVCERYIADKWCAFIFTAAGFRDLFSLLKSVSTEEWAENVPQNLPIYIFSGDDDPVGGHGKGVLKVEKLLKETGHRDVELKLYEGGRHEMRNETNREEVKEDILKFLEKVICDSKDQ